MRSESDQFCRKERYIDLKTSKKMPSAFRNNMHAILFHLLIRTVNGGLVLKKVNPTQQKHERRQTNGKSVHPAVLKR